MFPEYNRTKVEINNGKISGKFLSIWKLNKTLLNNRYGQWMS